MEEERSFSIKISQNWFLWISSSFDSIDEREKEREKKKERQRLISIIPLQVELFRDDRKENTAVSAFIRSTKNHPSPPRPTHTHTCIDPTPTPSCINEFVEYYRVCRYYDAK